MIAHGGAGCWQDIATVIRDGHVDAICLASLLHYRAVRELPMPDDLSVTEGNTEFLRKHRFRGFSRVHDLSLPELKAALLADGIGVRPFQQGVAA